MKKVEWMNRNSLRKIQLHIRFEKRKKRKYRRSLQIQSLKMTMSLDISNLMRQDEFYYYTGEPMERKNLLDSKLAQRFRFWGTRELDRHFQGALKN